MTQYSITCKCGHVETIRLYGSNAHGELDRRAELRACRECSACKAERSRKSHNGMAALEGTDRQVAYAAGIRRSILTAIWRNRAVWAEDKGSDDMLAAADRIIAWLKGRDKASWWISHKYVGAAVRAALDDMKAQAQEA